MGRRRSGGTGTTRLLQGIFALAWIVFLCYMVSGYLGRQPIEESATTEPPSSETPGKSDKDDLSLNPPGSSLADSGADLTTPPADSLSGPSAKQILQNVIAAYQKANAYSDDGQIIMSSKINGSLIDERYRWQTSWTRDGLLAAEIFDSSVRSDGKILSCFVSSIEKENLDNQQLFLTGQGLIKQLYNDPIANFYLNGGDRIPVNEELIPNSVKLAPFALSLLTGQVQSSLFLPSSRSSRLPDEVLKDARKNAVADCYVVQIDSVEGKFVVWIDKKNSMVRQIRLPVEYLAPRLTTDPNIKDFLLTATMHNAKFSPPENQFERVYPRTADVWPVRKFVATTQPLPSNLIGQQVPEFELSDATRRPVSEHSLERRTTVMMWLNDGDFDLELIQNFAKVKSALEDNTVEFMVVVGPAMVRVGENDTWTFSPTIQPTINRSKLPFFADLKGKAMQAFEFESLPSVVVIDQEMNVQFADQIATSVGYNGFPKISEGWERGLVWALEAIQKGKDVSQDMLAAYRTQLDQYDKEKNQYLAADLFPHYVVPGKSRIAAVPATVRREKIADKSKLQLNPKLVWKSNQLEMPGGIAEVPDQNRRATRHLILDGWQTITMFSLDGDFLAQKKLDLPARTAVTSIRPVLSGKGESAFAMFSVGGREVFLFDGKMNLVAQYPESPSASEPVLACEVIEGESKRNDKLLICYGGSRGAEMVDPFSGTVRNAGPTVVRSVAIKGRDVVAVDDRSGALLSMDDGRILDGNREYVHVRSGASGATRFAATGMNERQEWSLIGLSSDLREAWSFPIASPIFENGLEPIVGVNTSGSNGVWAIADSSNRIFLLSDSGQWLGDLAGDGNVRGISLLQIGNRTRLVVSTDKLVECWDLNFAPERIGQIGSRTE